MSSGPNLHEVAKPVHLCTFLALVDNNIVPYDLALMLQKVLMRKYSRLPLHVNMLGPYMPFTWRVLHV